MLKIHCPWCGPRAESEFSYGGEAHIARPLDTDALSDKEWADYLFMRKNPKGERPIMAPKSKGGNLLANSLPTIQ